MLTEQKCLENKNEDKCEKRNVKDLDNKEKKKKPFGRKHFHNGKYRCRILKHKKHGKKEVERC